MTRWPYRALIYLFCLQAVTLAIAAPHPSKQDASWKTYSNKDLGYCISYPARWVRGEAFDGAGMYFESGVKKFSKPLGEMDIGPLSGSRPDAASSPVEYVQVHLDGLRKFERAQQLEVLEQRNIDLLGMTGFFTKDRYFDPQDRATWVDEIVLAKHGDTLFRLELACRADQLDRFEPVFTRFVASFQFECNRRR